MKKNWFLASVIGFVAAIVYFASTADYAFPGESAKLLACWKGLDSTPLPSYPFMAAVASWCGGGNVIAPICGTIAVLTLFHLVAAFVGSRVRNEEMVRRREEISLLAATTAALVFLFTPGVRSAATHLEP